MSSEASGSRESSPEKFSPLGIFEMFHKLKLAATDQEAAFCCGGTVPITITGANQFASIWRDEPVKSPPVVLRWDLPSGKSIRKLTLPPIDGSERTTAIDELLNDCSPATFGHKAVEVLDESYKKAVKLDNSQFCTTFSPYDFGIIDAIAQTLLPGKAVPFTSDKTCFLEHLGVIAELYKLNIYSGPSGKFRAHVDTPRSANQFGSLVVCLPHPHEGGQLRVAHKGHEHVYDWSSEKADTIEWAAFYSDCEHEVLEVKRGHRVTLTYNLYVHEQVGGVLRPHPTANPELYPLFAIAKEALACPGFFEEVMEDIDDGHGHSDEDRGRLVGLGLHRVKISDVGGYDDSLPTTSLVKKAWGNAVWCDYIEWINGTGPKELAVVHLNYGNQPGVEWHYSYAAILIVVPPYKQRIAKLDAKATETNTKGKAKEVDQDRKETELIEVAAGQEEAAASRDEEEMKAGQADIIPGQDVTGFQDAVLD